MLCFLYVDEGFAPAFRRVNASRDFKRVALHRIIYDGGALSLLRRALWVA